MSDLAARPDGAVVGKRMPHESAAQHATGIATYTDLPLILPRGLVPTAPVTGRG